MRTIGFSTGALAYADFRRGLEMMKGKRVTAVELSALRIEELQPLYESAAGLDLSGYAYVAVHAPSRFVNTEEASVAGTLAELNRRGWPIVLHPDAVHDFGVWREFGSGLLVENMDKRKPGGRTVAELAQVFEQLPEAGFCFDIGHARQVDPTMTVAHFLLREFGGRLRQLHVSEVNTRSRHDSLSLATIRAFQKVAHQIPESVPVILESPVAEAEIGAELARAEESLRGIEDESAVA